MKKIELFGEKYCDICKINILTTGNIYKEYKDDVWTGRYLCRSCYSKDYNKKYYSYDNDPRKYMRNIRINNLDRYSSSGKGLVFELVTCKARSLKNLNIESDNYSSKLDHSIDPEYGILQTKGSIAELNSLRNKYWKLSTRNEKGKRFNNLIFYCADKNFRHIENVYIFPEKEVISRNDILIKDQNIKSWYDKYLMQDIEIYNNAIQFIMSILGNKRYIGIDDAKKILGIK